MAPPPESPASPNTDELADACVRESRITTHRDARFRRIVGTSLFVATVMGGAAAQEPHLGICSLSFNACAFGFLQGVFHQ